MEQSILKSTKEILGIDSSYTAYDLDIMTHINGAFARLNSLGIGVEGFMIEDDEPMWGDFLPVGAQQNRAKTYVHLSVKLAFDPPPTSFHLQSAQAQLEKQEWVMSAERENLAWVPPVSIPPYTVGIVDGGDP